MCRMFECCLTPAQRVAKDRILTFIMDEAREKIGNPFSDERQGEVKADETTGYKGITCDLTVSIPVVGWLGWPHIHVQKLMESKREAQPRCHIGGLEITPNSHESRALESLIKRKKKWSFFAVRAHLTLTAAALVVGMINMIYFFTSKEKALLSSHTQAFTLFFVPMAWAGFSFVASVAAKDPECIRGQKSRPALSKDDINLFLRLYAEKSAPSRLAEVITKVKRDDESSRWFKDDVYSAFGVKRPPYTRDEEAELELEQAESVRKDEAVQGIQSTGYAPLLGSQAV